MEAKERLLEFYRLAVANGIVKNRKEFAALINTAEGTLSNSLNGVPKYAGTASTLAKRAEDALAALGISISAAGDGSMQNINGSNNQVGVPSKNFAHEGEWFSLVAEKDKQISKSQEQIDRLLTIIEKMQSR